ncbi:MAG: sigma-70 family RNA polymerase sigma factor [Firmicutes bacterium]|nr:sigma-70 family RNA polymerase sigma factor [Bacillota bacterium]
MQEPRDEELVSQARDGSQDAFRDLVLRYEPRVTALCGRILGSRADAEDAAISAFIKAWQALPRFNPSRPFAPWLFTIAAREATSVARSRKDWLPLEETGYGGTLVDKDRSGNPEHAVVDREEARSLEQALARLEPIYRAALVLRYQLDRSYAEIAVILKVPAGTVATLLHRGKQKLRSCLEEEEA